MLYQVYPRSFQDSDGDGVGDLAGVARRLDQLAWLGVDAIWLNPVHPSPNADWGYDVADYLDVAPEFGGLEALDALVAEAARRDIRVLLDLVPNHTSAQHPWFLDAMRGREAAHRDRYVWADPAADGGPPNNWRSTFGGPAWTLDERSGQYYLHNFLPEQPDLNWWHDDVRAAFDEILRFWFDRGIAGFRIDVANAIVKDRELRNDPLPTDDPLSPGEATAASHEIFSMHRPEVHDVLQRWREIARTYEPERVLVGETWARDLPDLARYYGDGDELHLAFNFAFATAPFEAAALREVVEATERALGEDAWPLWTASNHDIGRLASHWAEGDDARIRCALFVLLLLRGTPVLYAGDEIGLPDEVVPQARRVDRGRRSDGRGRDDGRTPMPWTRAPGGGFTEAGVEPWLPIGEGAPPVDEQREDPTSVLHWCRRLISLRRALPELHEGAQVFLETSAGVLAWQRGAGTVAMANLSPRPATATLPTSVVMLATDPALEGTTIARVALSPWACILGRGPEVAP